MNIDLPKPCPTANWWKDLRVQNKNIFKLWIPRFIATLILSCLGTPAFAIPTQGHQIMYAGPSPYGPEIVRDIYSRHGNVVDAAVAVSLSLAVTHPYFAAFGGGGFALVKLGSEVHALDYREMGPEKISGQNFAGKPPEASRDGGLAVAIPGVPSGLWELHKKFGRLKWAQLFTIALNQAEKGFRVSGEWADFTNENRTRFSAGGHKAFFHHKGSELKPLLPGEVLQQPGLARFLRLYRQKGPDAFYQGEVAQDITKTVNSTGGIFGVNELKNYHARWLQPMSTEFNGYKVWLMPPPSSGGVIIAQALKLIEKTKLLEKKPLSVSEFHYLAEILKMSFRGRSLLGDPAFSENPIQKLLDDQTLTAIASQIQADHTMTIEPSPTPTPAEDDNTTHFSVMDADGNAVALTVTLNGDYGSGLVSEKFGIALNNEVDDFTTQPGKPNMFGLIQGEANMVRAGARPLSSMSPTIVEKQGQTILAVGAPGGSRIISAVLQVLYRVLGQNFNIDLAIQTPRVHHQFQPDVVRMDNRRFSPEVVEGLEKLGHKTVFGSTARVYGVVREVSAERGPILSAAGDARGECAAGGF
jgi:gamma-glutamyltranspeptidase / glutathione hydrolase